MRRGVLGAALIRAAVAVCASGLVGACGGGRSADAETQPGAVVALPTVVELVAQRRADALSDTVPLFRVMDLVGWADTVAVVDGGNDRVVVLDGDLAPVRLLGRHGSGPDELSGVFSIAASAGGLVIGDKGNGRFARYGRDGAFLNTAPTPRVPLDFAVTSAGDLLVPTFAAETYLVRLGADGQAVPFGKRPRPIDVDAAPLKASLDLVAVTAGDTVHVLDNVRGRLLKYAPDGGLVLDRPVPFVDAERIGADAAARARDMGALYAGGFAKKLSVTPDGRLLVLTGADSVWALLLSPGDYGGAALLDPHAPHRARFHGATAAYLNGTDVFLVWEDDVFRYRLLPGMATEAGRSP